MKITWLIRQPPIKDYADALRAQDELTRLLKAIYAAHPGKITVTFHRAPTVLHVDGAPRDLVEATCKRLAKSSYLLGR